MRADPSTFPPTPVPSPPPAGARNVLHIIVDDLRPDLAPFGPTFMSTPALAALASSGTLFSRAYTNIAVCSPSRMSFLTGRRPGTTSCWNFINHFRQAECREEAGVGLDDATLRTVAIGDGGAGQCCSHCVADPSCGAWTMNAGGCHLKAAATQRTSAPNAISGVRGGVAMRGWTSLPGAFLRTGYATRGSGKVWHTEEGGNGPAPWDGQGMPPLQDPPSWSRIPNATMGDVNAVAPMWPCAGGAKNGTSACTEQGDADGVPGVGVKPFEDAVIGSDARLALAQMAAARSGGGPPFYLAVGFRKPHLPQRHPSAYDALYPPIANTTLARYGVLDASVPPIAYHTTSLAQSPYVPLETQRARTIRHDYYAAISWVDHEVGRLLAALDATGLANDTLVLFHGDHGWSLGEHGEWVSGEGAAVLPSGGCWCCAVTVLPSIHQCKSHSNIVVQEKFSNWEHGARVPLVIRAPWVTGAAGSRSDALAELVDVMPTVLELAGVAPPPGETLEGQSLVPAIEAAAAHLPVPTTMRPYALTVYPRCPASTNASLMWQDNDCLYVERSRFVAMGVSLRTDRYRYTEWSRWNGSALSPMWDTDPIGVELYDHQGDDGSSFDGPYEVVNHADDPAYAAIRAQLATTVRAAYGGAATSGEISWLSNTVGDAQREHEA